MEEDNCMEERRGRLAEEEDPDGPPEDVMQLHRHRGGRRGGWRHRGAEKQRRRMQHRPPEDALQAQDRGSHVGGRQCGRAESRRGRRRG